MSGTKPITHNVVRSFRGQSLYLVSLHANHGFRWVADRKQALALSTPEEALKIAERASREYGAICTVVDSHEAPHVIERASSGPGNRVALALEFYRRALARAQKPCNIDTVRYAAIDEYGLSGSEQTGLDEEIAIDARRVS